MRSAGVVSNRATGTTRTVYRCRENGVGPVARAAEPVDALVEAVVLDRLSQPDAAGLFRGQAGADVAALREQASGLRARLDGLTELYADGVLTEDQLRSATGRVRARLGDAEATIAAQNDTPS